MKTVVRLRHLADLTQKQFAGVCAFLTLLFMSSLFMMGQPAICQCGYIKLWHGAVLSSENSQHLTDWYTPSHVIHGFLLYFFLWLFFPKMPLRTRFLLAFVLEGGWELFENTDFIINRYREVTISLDYFGDSIINSTADLFAALLGFVLAARLPVHVSVFLALLMEAVVGYSIRDNLTLNIIMLVHPTEAIRAWQSGVSY